MDLNPLTVEWLAKRQAIRRSRVKLGLDGYAHLCGILRDQALTIRDLTAAAQMGHVAAYRFVMSMHAMKFAHIEDWLLKPNSRPLPMFRLGPGDDAPAPTSRRGRRIENAPLPKSRLCPGVIPFVNLLRLMDDSFCSRQEMERETGLHKNTIQTGLETLLALKFIHIGDWGMRPQGGAPIPLFIWGEGVTARKPKRKRASERNNSYTAKLKHLRMIHATAGGAAANDERRAA